MGGSFAIEAARREWAGGQTLRRNDTYPPIPPHIAIMPGVYLLVSSRVTLPATDGGEPHITVMHVTDKGANVQHDMEALCQAAKKAFDEKVLYLTSARTNDFVKDGKERYDILLDVSPSEDITRFQEAHPYRDAIKRTPHVTVLTSYNRDERDAAMRSWERQLPLTIKIADVTSNLA